MINSLIYLQEYTEEASNIASEEDIMENNYYMFVMIGNLSVMSHVPVTWHVLLQYGVLLQNGL